MAAVLLALGMPLAASVAGAQQQKVVVDRIDDTARFAALAQFVTVPSEAEAPLASSTNERRETLERELASYYDVYDIRAGVFYPTRTALATAPQGWNLPQEGEVRDVPGGAATATPAAGHGCAG